MNFPSIPTLSESSRAAAQAILDNKTKPLGSLGRLEEIAAWMCAVQDKAPFTFNRKRVIVFAADHGVAASGVSAFPQEVTVQMVANYVTGGAGVCVLARLVGAELEIVDAGVAGETIAPIQAKVARGTKNFCAQAAMTKEEAIASIEVGMKRADRAAKDGMNLITVGEMGIGNTASSAALLALLTGQPVADLVGRGTGLTDAGLQHKINVLTEAVEFHKDVAGNPLACLAAVGGFEIGAMAGAMIGAASHRIPVMVDGFICTVAALLAVRLVPECRPAMMFAHRSVERGQALALRELGADPLLDLGMRLGEASGSALAIHLVEAAHRVMTEMASFESAGVSTQTN